MTGQQYTWEAHQQSHGGHQVDPAGGHSLQVDPAAGSHGHQVGSGSPQHAHHHQDSSSYNSKSSEGMFWIKIIIIKFHIKVLKSH